MKLLLALLGLSGLCAGAQEAMSYHTTTIDGIEYQIPITGEAKTYYAAGGQLLEAPPAPTTQYVLNEDANQDFLKNCMATCEGEGPECGQGCRTAASTLTGMQGQEFRNIQQIQSNIASAIGMRPAQEGTIEYIPAQSSNVPQPRQAWAQPQPQWDGRQWVKQRPQQTAQSQFQAQSTFGGLVPGQSAAQSDPNLPSGTPHVRASIPKFGVPVLTMEDFNQRYGGSRFPQGQAPEFGQVLSGPGAGGLLQNGGQQGFYTQRTRTSWGGQPQFGQTAPTRRFSAQTFRSQAFGGQPQYAAPASQYGSQNYNFGGQGISGLRGGFFKRRK